MPRLVSRPDADADVEAAFDWYEGELSGLGQQFLDELLLTYERIAAGPLRYQLVAGEVRRSLLRRFPYAVYFIVEAEAVVVLAVLHASRDPAEWQRRV